MLQFRRVKYRSVEKTLGARLRGQDKSKQGLLVRSARESMSAHWVTTMCRPLFGSLGNVRSLSTQCLTFWQHSVFVSSTHNVCRLVRKIQRNADHIAAAKP